MTSPPFDRAAVQAHLDAFCDHQAARLAPLGPDAERLLAAARVAVTGGKRLRGEFVHTGFLVVRSIGDQAEEVALMAACAAVEVLHASALVHDDYMDASDTRRGKPAAHRYFADEHTASQWRGSSEAYGAAGAILLGDLLLSWADEMLRLAGFDHHVTAEALSLLDLTRSEVIAGQFLDVSTQARGDVDLQQAMRVLRYKSAKYSVERPLHLGAALAGGSQAVQTMLTGYGIPLGEAFQLRDDLLGVFGDPAVTGKPAGDDLSEGKRTVLVSLAVANCDTAAAARLDASLGTNLDEREVAELQNIITESGALGEVEQRIENLTAQALDALNGAPCTPEMAVKLRQLALAATQRTV